MKANGARVTLGCLNTIFALFSSQKQSGKCRTRVASASLEITHRFRTLLLPPTESGYTSDLSEQLSGRVPPLLPVWLTPYGCARGWGGCALLREGRDKSSSERIRKERTGKSGTGGFPHPTFSASLLESADKSWSGRGRGSGEGPHIARGERWKRRRDGFMRFFSWVCRRKVSEIYPRFIQLAMQMRCR